ncbi:hypothetical protein BO94DRAFT_558211 [Aspergillus sclerotioniger CBS 115572]|uniref:Aminoglycoside phosphotransferase domain-containing protein n=1 Tax=Aspergillus sclerotioniger CBS 115572 TaxID=1450535 RepID=A0A317W2I6_9EURO|nr:hypothetical protein BO94DRAFT_558211 [Aspergillus sclerotioniger CBS 115572]PWY80794.1 hypothetical protein BO94DRAFT_558211 [Aspergillus sclerotioniger CBS 115572]
MEPIVDVDYLPSPVVQPPTSRDPDRVFPLDGIDLKSMRDESLVTLLHSAPVLHQLGETTVVRLSKDLVMKGGGNVLPSEAAVMKLIESETRVRAPRVHRSFQVPDSTKYFGTMGYIVMDYIRGQPLDHCWGSLDEEPRHDVASQVANMILGMQSVKVTQPGPICGGPCCGRFFTDYGAGPSQNKSEMEIWFNHKLAICKNSRNLILDPNGHVWLIDWADAGAYPPAFESAALDSQQSFPDFNAMVLSPIPSYPVELGQLRSIEYGLQTAAFA